MLKKKLLTGIIAVMILSISACGSSKEQKTTKTQNAKTENVQRETVSDKEVRNETTPEDNPDEMNNYEICMTYFNFRSGLETEEDTIEHLQILGVTLDEAEVIFEQYGGNLAEELALIEADTPVDIPHFDATDEIKNAPMQQFKIQVADMVFDPFTKVPEYIDQIENSVLPFTYEYTPDKLIPCPGGTDIDIYLNNEPYMTLHVCNAAKKHNDSETRTLEECIVYNIELKDLTNVYYTGGIPAINGGISVDEFDEQMKKNIGDVIEESDLDRSESLYNNCYILEYKIRYRMSLSYVFECDGAAQSCYSYTYKATFNGTGTELESLTLEFKPIGGFRYEPFGLNETDIIIER